MYRGGIISLPGKVRKYLLEEMTFEPYVRTDKVDGSLERRHREKRYSRQRCRGLAASKKHETSRDCKEFSEVTV